MAILINKKLKIILQGFTGKIGSFHAEEMMKCVEKEEERIAIEEPTK